MTWGAVPVQVGFVFMRLDAAFHRRLRRLGFPTTVLVALLQRTPVPPIVPSEAELVAISPIGMLLRSAAAVASLGAIHSLAGATTIVISKNVTNPLNVTVGQAIPTVAFGVSGTGLTASSWQVSLGSTIFPPGLVFSAGPSGPNLTDAGFFNSTDPTLTGTPLTAGSYQIILEAWESPNRQGPSAPLYTYTINVTPAAGAPTIAAQPQGQTVVSGTTVAFTVAVAGVPDTDPAVDLQRGEHRRGDEHAPGDVQRHVGQRGQLHLRRNQFGGSR